MPGAAHSERERGAREPGFLGIERPRNCNPITPHQWPSDPVDGGQLELAAHPRPGNREVLHRVELDTHALCESLMFMINAVPKPIRLAAERAGAWARGLCFMTETKGGSDEPSGEEPMLGQDPAATAQPAAARIPTYEELLATPILERDDPGVAAVSYPGWQVDHASARRFYLMGCRWVEVATGVWDAKTFHDHVPAATEFIHSETNWPQIGGNWDAPAYNQFRRVHAGDVMTFDRGAFVLAAYAVKFRDWALQNNRDPLECFEHLKLLPACFNLDAFDGKVLSSLRLTHANVSAVVAAASAQRNLELLDDMVRGRCVTLSTARAVRDAINGLTGEATVGPVCGRPGRQRGRGPASQTEFLELNRLPAAL